MLSSCVSEFRHLREFGTTDYRKSVRILRQGKGQLGKAVRIRIYSTAVGLLGLLSATSTMGNGRFESIR